MNKSCYSLLLLVVVVACACARPAPYMQHQGMALGTTYNIQYQLPGEDRLGDDIVQLLSRFEDCLSVYRPGSLISRINKNDTTALADPWFREVFRVSEVIHAQSNGAFDITVAPLVNYWGFGPEAGALSTPDSAHVRSLLPFVGMDKVRMEGNRVVKKHPELILDMNAVAKGYACDVVASFLEQKGCTNYLVEIGGEIHARGLNSKGVVWRVGIDRPEEGLAPGEELQLIVALQNRSLATSGNYRKFHLIDGVKYAHTIDPRTGFPVRHQLLSATILASSCMFADAWATACMASGPEKSKEFLEEHPELDGCLMIATESGAIELYLTPGMQSIILNE